MNNTIECTCILSDNQLARLQAVTETIKRNTKNKYWSNQMTMQLCIGNTHLTEMLLTMLENYVENNFSE